jgi:hypothetical protein
MFKYYECVSIFKLSIDDLLFCTAAVVETILRTPIIYNSR